MIKVFTKWSISFLRLNALLNDETLYWKGKLFTQVLIEFMKNKRKKSITLILRNYFITGVVVLIPICFTLYLRY